MNDLDELLAPPPRRAPAGPTTGRRAAVLGSPVDHSRSPDLHLAAYRALGFEDWAYRRIECTAEDLPDLVDGLDASYVGLSVTMPGKTAALVSATERTDRASLVGSANTLVRIDGGWRADCTDIDGMVGALRAVGAVRRGGSDDTVVETTAVLIGAGGTALPTVAALAATGVGYLGVVARNPDRARVVLDLAARLGMSATLLDFVPSEELAARCADADVTVSTVPAPAAGGLAPSVSAAPRLVDVIYSPWPTPLAEAVTRSGGHVVGGLTMLLHQAFGQVEQFTGRPAPRETMARVLGLPEP